MQNDIVTRERGQSKDDTRWNPETAIRVNTIYNAIDWDGVLHCTQFFCYVFDDQLFSD